MANHKSSRRRLAAVFGTVLALTIATAVPASAGSGGAMGPYCSTSFHNSTTLDRAWSVLNSGNCGPLTVRHRFTQGGVTYWTMWRNLSTLETPQLNLSQHRATILAVQYTYNVNP